MASSLLEASCMNEAILEAKKSLEEWEISIGSVIEYQGKIIGLGHNRRV